MTALVRLLAGIWLGLAHLVGGIVRRIGSSARELDPELRRNGVGLVFVGLAIVVAAAVWWQLPGAAGGAVRSVVSGSVGTLAWAMPLLLLLVAWRTLRHPDRNGPGGRQLIGWAAILGGVLGLVHIQHDLPRPDSGIEELESAGGAIGYVMSSILSDLLTVYVAVPLLVLLTLFGVLVLVGTPLHALPDRSREFWAKVRHKDAEAGADKPADETAVDEDGKQTQPLRRSRSRRRIGAMAGSDGDDARRREALRQPRARGPRDLPARQGEAACRVRAGRTRGRRHP